MRPYQVLDTSDLMHVLAEYTARYTKMLTEGEREKDLINCRETIQSLIAEAELRRKDRSSTDPSSKQDR